MRRTTGLVSFLLALVGVGLTACPKNTRVTTTTPTAGPRHSFNVSGIRSFTDTYAVSTLADTPNNLFVGSTRGLVRWDIANMKYSVITTKDGLPADRITALTVDKSGAVWVATPAGVAHSAARGPWLKAPAAPVGDFLAGLVPAGDGQSMWAGGPEGLARLPPSPSPALTPIWTRTLSDVAVTAMLPADGGAIWIGTAGRGVMRLSPDGETIETYGTREGCEVDVVRGMALLDKGLLVVGEGPNGPRVGYWDPGLDRFFSYTLEAPKKGAQPPVLGFAARGAGHTYVGLGQGAVAEVVVATLDKDGKWSVSEPTDTPLRLVARPTAPAPAPRRVALKADLQSTALDEPAPAGAAPATPPAKDKKKDKKEVPAAGPPAPHLVLSNAEFRLPEGVTATASSDRGLLVGTRFLGAIRIENGVPRRFRTHDLTAGAERLTVACQGDDCYLATGTARAWRFDGQSFENAQIDPEPGSRILAVLADPRGGALAIHRGAKDSILRLSTVADKLWTPVGIQSVLVPYGPPDLNFAVYAPSGSLWVGLRYYDRESDPVDFGAAEITLESGQVTYHNQSGPPPAPKSPPPSSSSRSRRAAAAAAAAQPPTPAATVGTTLPNDMVSMYWKAGNEAWFATRSGAARMLDNKVTLFTEAEGMESELIRDIGPGPHSPLEEPNEIWVATGHGTGKYDGKRWTFPKMGPFYLKTNALAYDGKGHIFLGTEKGIYCVGDCDTDAIDERRGLIENAILDLTVDTRGRVWVLTPRGISIIEP